MWLLATRPGKDTRLTFTLLKIAPDTLQTVASYTLGPPKSSGRFKDYQGFEIIGRRLLLVSESGAEWFDEAGSTTVPAAIPQNCQPFIHRTVTTAWLWSCNRFDNALAIRPQEGTENRYRFEVPENTHPLFASPTDELRWIHTHDLTNLYSVDFPGGVVTHVPWSPRFLGGAQQLAQLNGQVYFAGAVNVVQWEPDSDLTFSLLRSAGSYVERAALSMLSTLTTRTILSDGVVGLHATYTRPPIDGVGMAKIDTLPNDHFQVRVKESGGIQGPDIPVTDTVTIPIPLNAALWRRVDMEFDLVDGFGNRRLVTERILVMSSLVVGTSAWYALLVSVMLVVVLAAPYNRFANNFIMNPYLRRWGTLLAVPLMLTLCPPLRRHLLKRYRQSLGKQVKPLAHAYVVPDPALDIAAIVATLGANMRPVWLYGPSGIGKTAWMYYACHRLTGPDAPAMTARDLPVLVLLRDYQDMEPEKVFLEALKARGQFDDVELAGEILRQGTVLFLVDGLNEVSATVQARWLGFARVYSGTHRFILTSQMLPKEGGDFSVVQVTELSAEKAREIVRVKAPTVATQLDTLPPGASVLVRNPANLLVVARLLEEGRDVPETEYELYRAVFHPLRQRWMESGVPSNLEDLRMVAADFATNGRGDLVAERRFSDQEQLIAARVLVRRDGRLFFASDRIAAFLVASAIVEDTPALRRMSPAFNAQWRLIVDMLSHVVDLSAADMVMSELVNREPPAIDLADFFAASLKRS
ncbi:MAG: NACHT domain-containing protein, partial [Vicinamibacterales bacterium]